METVEVTYYQFILRICNEFGIPNYKERALKLPNDKRSIKNFTTSVASEVRIFDGNNEHPYMLPGLINKRNDEVLKVGVELRKRSSITMKELLQETGAKVTTAKCKISEGGGWYSEGTKYTYKDITCES